MADDFRAKLWNYLINDSIPAQAAKSAWSGITYPGDVLAGKARPDDLGRALDFAGVPMMGSMAVPVSSGEIRSGLGIPMKNSVNDLEEYASSLGASLSVSQRSNGDLVVGKVVVPKEMRNSGIGSQIMTRVIEDADANGRTVSLTPSSDFGGNKAKLVEFYKRFGFEPNSGRNKDFAISESMRRYPLKPNEL